MNTSNRSKRILRRMTAACVTGLIIPLKLAGSPYSLEWTRLPSLPEPTGLKGYYVLDSGSTHLLMGGSAFPNSPSTGGQKVYSDRIYQLCAPDIAGATWKKTDMRLPVPVAGGLSIPVGKGAVLIGGRNQDTILDNVLKVSWSEENTALETQVLPSLPEACFYPTGTLYKDQIYVAGGNNGSSGLSSFQMLDLVAPSEGWKTLPSWPGPPLFGAILKVMNDGYKDYLYLFGGKSRNTTPRSQSNYSRAVYRFDPVKERWEELKPMPRAALLGIPLEADPSRLIIMGGSDGHDIERLDQIMDTYRLPSEILLYSAINDSWQVVGDMPLGLAGATLFKADDGFILAGGEYAPARRTNRAYHIKLKEELPE